MTVKIAVKNLYKIFGDASEEALEKVKAGMGKAELLESTGQGLGLHNVNVRMKEGEITVIMGLSGSGKSTLVRCLNRLIEPTGGEILLDGENVLAFDEAQLREMRRKRMSMVFQKFALFPHRTVLQNTALAMTIESASLKEREAEAEHWLGRVGLDGYGASMPDQLSGGMQQRVGLARALASNAEVMLMDEAFSALDPLIRTDMQNLLIELQRELKKTIVFITHDLDEALKLADHLVILKDGAVVQQGEPQRILLKPKDPYVENFIGDINRARVLRTRSVMQSLQTANRPFAGDVDHDDNLESVIARAEGEVDRVYRVVRDGQPVGALDMRDLLRALVPAEPTGLDDDDEETAA
ncbi:MAG: betaine/proline/choline family ABC transporter ATP-binding protein [Neomegalonema sp.]|nr:betaine/proline/choline family ABC transporter ATP-binding protein [Neomegalonema sp.]